MSGSAPLVLSCKVLAHSIEPANPEPPPPSRPLSIASRRAFGVCPSKHANEVVDALHFETHLADAQALSRLTVRGDGAHYMAIHAVDRDLIVLDWSLPPERQSPVYLVYDAVGQSLTMIPSSPWRQLAPVQPDVKRCTAPAISVLVARLPSGYALVKMAETAIYNWKEPNPVEKQDVLYVWRSSSRSLGWWDLIRAEFPPLFKRGNVPRSYGTVLAFTCSGHAFWANLFHGIMYCSLDTLLSAPTRHDGPKLMLEFISLPVECPDDTPGPISGAMEMNSYMHRTIGCSGVSSVKFVTIDGFVQLLDFDKCTLMVWTLSPDDDMTRWTKRVLCLGSLATQSEFKEAGLPTDMVPMCPSLSAEEDDVVYFRLGEYKKCCGAHRGTKNRCNGYIPAAKNSRYHLCVDMRRGLLLASARLPDRISTSVSIASTSLVPSSLIQRGSRDNPQRGQLPQW